MENTFVMPVDAAFYQFRFAQVQAVEVKYQTFRSDLTGNILVYIDSVSIAPSLLKELVSPARLHSEIEKAARHNAESFWKLQDQEPVIIP